MRKPFTNPPEHFIETISNLHKFRPYNLRTLESLMENYIWFAGMDKMNDPFEGLIDYRKDLTYEAIIRAEVPFYPNADGSKDSELVLREEFKSDANAFIMKYRKKHIEAYELFLRKARTQGCFSVFSEPKNSNKIPNSKILGSLDCQADDDLFQATQDEDLRMWSYYGDGLRGLRITYSPEKILLSEELTIAAIKYQEKPDSVDATAFCSELYYGSGPRYKASILPTRFLTKGIFWSYEKEIRLKIEKQGKFHIPEDSISSITFGCKMPKEQKEMIKNVAIYKNPNIKFYEARMSDSEFLIDYIEMHN